MAQDTLVVDKIPQPGRHVNDKVLLTFSGYRMLVYPNGKPKIVAQYKDGEPFGTWTYFHPKGEKLNEEHYNEWGEKEIRYLTKDKTVLLEQLSRGRYGDGRGAELYVLKWHHPEKGHKEKQPYLFSGKVIEYDSQYNITKEYFVDEGIKHGISRSVRENQISHWRLTGGIKQGKARLVRGDRISYGYFIEGNVSDENNPMNRIGGWKYTRVEDTLRMYTLDSNEDTLATRAYVLDDQCSKTGVWRLANTLKVYRDNQLMSSEVYNENGELIEDLKRVNGDLIGWKTGRRGSRYESKNGKKHGKYISHKLDIPVVLKGQFKDGKREGLWELNYNYEEHVAYVEVGAYKNGRKHGIWLRWLNSEISRLVTDTLLSRGEYKNGVKTGPWIEDIRYSRNYKSDSYAISRGSYANGNKVGQWTTDFGDTRMRQTYDDGQLIELSFHDPNGSLKNVDLEDFPLDMHRLYFPHRCKERFAKAELSYRQHYDMQTVYKVFDARNRLICSNEEKVTSALQKQQNQGLFHLRSRRDPFFNHRNKYCYYDPFEHAYRPYTGKVVDDRPNLKGKNTYTYRVEGNMVDGDWLGPYIRWYTEDNQSKVERCVYDQERSTCTKWHGKHKEYERTNYFIADKVDSEIHYDSTGSVAIKRYSRRGLIFHEIRYYPNGNKRLEEKYASDTSYHWSWFSNGQLVTKGLKEIKVNMYGAKMHIGKWSFYDSTGAFMGEVTYGDKGDPIKGTLVRRYPQEASEERCSCQSVKDRTLEDCGRKPLYAGPVAQILNYADSSLHGWSEAYYRNGRICDREYYTNGLRDSLHSYWNEKGQLIEEKRYAEGQLHGAQQKWNNNVLVEEQYYKNRRKHGTHRKWNDQGLLVLSENYENNCLEGLKEEWHANGQQKLQEPYKGCRLNGRRKEWNENGELITSERYKDGLSQQQLQRRKEGEKNKRRDRRRNKRLSNYLFRQRQKSYVEKKHYSSGAVEQIARMKNDGYYGRVRRFYQNGQRESVRLHKPRKYPVHWRAWYENGKKQHVRHHILWGKFGREKVWDSNGNLNTVKKFRWGKFKTYRVFGQVFDDWTHERRLLQGKYIKYERGQRIQKQRYKGSGYRVGTWKEWNAQGQLIKKVRY